MGYIEELKTIVGGENVHTGKIDCFSVSRDLSVHEGFPEAIVFARSTEEVVGVVRVAAEHKIPVTPRGAGTSVTGAALASKGGILLDLSRMNKIKELNKNDRYVIVEPGIVCNALNAQLEPTHFFPPDPGSAPICTIGGMIANNASGVQTVKYGATKDYIHRLTIVLPQGQVIQTGCRARKSSSGYDLTRLFVGSEGTLGVVTEATLRLAGIPEHHLAITITFDELSKASEAVAVLIGSGLEPAALELLTPGLIRLMNREKQLVLPEVPSLFCEFHGVSKGILNEAVGVARELCETLGATGFQYAIEEAHRKELWRARHEAWETIHRAHPGKETIIVDAAVPISRYPEMIIYSQSLLDEKGAIGYVFGHAGDGNLHVVLVGDLKDKKEWGILEEINHHIVTQAIRLGGTCTGEHGVGIGKRQFMAAEHGESYQLMRRIKMLVDPDGLMNPGKIF
jgi:D-lactate dehydrogenase (cytochrome)